MPRPLPAHLASAMLLWQSSRAGLSGLKSGSLPPNAGARLRALAGEIAQAGADQVAAALDRELQRRAERFLAGLEAYRRHPFQRSPAAAPVLWQEGATRLLDYGGANVGPAVLVVPSLINRYYVLDLLPERSFVRHLAGVGLRPLVIDWGEPGDAERGYGLNDYIAGRLDRAAGAAHAVVSAPIGLIGYCMGGLLALALALRRPSDIAGVAFLATPWDFHAERAAQPQLLGSVMELVSRFSIGVDTVPLAVLQSLFLSLDPFLAERKFARFGELDQAGEGARNFVALEDWINDGVALASTVAQECARSWYRDNEPGRGLWRVAGQTVDPGNITAPALVVVPRRDRIVPPRSAEALARVLPDAGVMRPPLGHIGMMSAAAAPELVWAPIAEWLRARLAPP